jgi:hypothetical protein
MIPVNVHDGTIERRKYFEEVNRAVAAYIAGNDYAIERILL